MVGGGFVVYNGSPGDLPGQDWSGRSTPSEQVARPGLPLLGWIPLSSDQRWWVGDGDQLDRLFGNVQKLASDFEADPLLLTGERV